MFSSLCVIVTTVPSPPIINAVTAVDSTSVQVQWSKPTNPNGILSIYTITYIIEGSGSVTENIPYNGQPVSEIHTWIIHSLSLHIHIYHLCALVTIL